MMKKYFSIAIVLLVILGILAAAYVRSAEFRTQDSSRLDDAAWFFLLLFLLVIIAIAIHYFGDSWFAVTRAKHRLKTIEPEHDAAHADVEAARREIAEREEAPGLWERRARELAAAYDGEYKAELARINARSMQHLPGGDGGDSDDL
jgi:hypothetical protein